MTSPAVDPLNLVDLDHALHDDERAIRETVRTFGAKRLRPHIAEWFESGNVPARELAPELGDLGLFGMHLNGYGCAGTSTSNGRPRIPLLWPWIFRSEGNSGRNEKQSSNSSLSTRM